MSRRWFLATPLSPALSDEGRATVDHLRSDAAADARADRAFAFIFSVAEQALTYHFREPLAALGVGLLTRKTLDAALDLALRGLRGPVRRILRGMDEAQLQGVADAIEERLYPDPHG